MTESGRWLDCPGRCGQRISYDDESCPACWELLPQSLRDRYIAALNYRSDGSEEDEHAAVVAIEFAMTAAYAWWDKKAASVTTRPRLTVIPGRGPQHPTACVGNDDGRRQSGAPGDREAPEKLAPRLYAIRGATQTCGHDNPTIAVRTDEGEVLSCRRCVLTAVDDRPGITYLEPMGPGGDDAA